MTDQSSGNPEPQPILHRAAATRAASRATPATPAAPTPVIDWCGRRHPAELILMACTVMAIILAVLGGILMGQSIDGPARFEDFTIFLVGQDEAGRHFVCENHGLIGGSFIDRETAIRFARECSCGLAGSLVVVTPAPVACH